MFSVPLIVPDLVLIPLIGAGLIFFLPNQYAVWARRVAISATFLTLVGALLLFTNYNPAIKEFQFSTEFPWVLSLGITYHVGLDGIGVVMVLLHAILSFAGALVSRSIA